MIKTGKLGVGGDGSDFSVANVAVITLEEERVTAQFDVPLHTPFHPWKTLPDCVVGVRVTFVPLRNEPVQVSPEQVRPDGLLRTLPLPSPVRVTLKELDGGGLGAKFALTEAEDVDRATTQGPLPVQAPLQPEKVLPPLGAAVSVTLVPCENVPEHVPLEQVTPPVTIPLPPPARVTLKELDSGGVTANDALTETEEDERATTQEAVPVHAPPQPENVFPLFGLAVRVIFAPCKNVPVHAPFEQDIPAGLLLTVPLPLTETERELFGPAIALDTSVLGGLSLPDAS